MLSKLLSLTDVAVIAHRGGAKLLPENTIASFDHAASLGVDAVECDVHLSRDGEVVVIHDSTLDRTTDARGPVASLSAAELARVDAGYHFGSREGHPFRGRGFGVPRLADLLDRYRDLPLIVEIKGQRPEMADTVLGVIAEATAIDRVIIGGFSDAVLARVRRLASDVITSASKDEVRSALRRAYFRLPPRSPRFQVFQVPYRFHGRRRFGRAFTQAARRAALPVQAWIVDDPDDMRRLLGWGVTGIISDRPDIALAIVRAKGKGQRAEER